MPIVLKTTRELAIMREACRISAGALEIAGKAIEPGITTAEIDKIAYDYIKSQGAEPNFLGLYGFPATACISINDEVIHGIPSKKRILQSGDIVSIDLGAKIGGYNGDNAATFACGEISEEAKRLIETTRESLYEAIKMAVPGGTVRRSGGRCCLCAGPYLPLLSEIQGWKRYCLFYWADSGTELETGTGDRRFGGGDHAGDRTDGQ